MKINIKYRIYNYKSQENSDNFDEGMSMFYNIIYRESLNVILPITKNNAQYLKFSNIMI